MSIHNDIWLKIGLKNETEAEHFLNTLTDAEGYGYTAEEYSFQTGNLFISTADAGGTEYEDGILTISGETSYREIDHNNIHLFFKEIKQIALESKVCITSMQLTFISQEDKGIHVYIDKLPPCALNEFLNCYVDPEDDDAEKQKEQYEKAIWCVDVSQEDIAQLAENDEEGRELCYELQDEILSRINTILSTYTFPEDITAFLFAVDDETGEELYSDCEA